MSKQRQVYLMAQIVKQAIASRETTGIGAVFVVDLKEDIEELMEEAIEQLSKQGTVYKPRHNTIKLTSKE